MTGVQTCALPIFSSESLLLRILKRAKELAQQGIDLYATPALQFFLYNQIDLDDLHGNGSFSTDYIASNFTRLDDTDIQVSAKYWSDHSDIILSNLSGRLIRRDLFAIELQNNPFPEEKVSRLKILAGDLMHISPEMAEYFVFTNTISNLTYTPDSPEVRILLKNGTTAEISSVSDMFEHGSVSERMKKYFLCYPKECR